MRVYSVTVKAFGRIAVRNYEAKSEAEAKEKALADVGFSIRATPQHRYATTGEPIVPRYS